MSPFKPPSIISDETMAILRIGHMTVFRNILIESYISQGQSNAQAESSADSFLATSVGTGQLNEYIRKEIANLQLEQIVGAVNRSNPWWKALGINLGAAAIGAFAGPFVVAALKAWLGANGG